MKARYAVVVTLALLLILVACEGEVFEPEPPVSPIVPTSTSPSTLLQEQELFDRAEHLMGRMDVVLSELEEMGAVDSESIVIQGDELSVLYVDEDQCERERGQVRYPREKSIIVVCVDDYDLRTGMWETFRWLNYHPETWWIYPSEYELLFLPVMR